jgi:hypothetical protein
VLALVEVLPTRIAPLFTDLVERMTDAEAQTDGDRFDGWPARLHILWALQKLIAYRSTYALAEAALFRLARAERDPQNEAAQPSSATEKWGASFRLYLSGTEVPLMERLDVLAKKLSMDGAIAVPLVLVGLGFALAGDGFKVEGHPIVSGEVRPPDWQPTTYAEIWDGLDAGIALLGQCLTYQAHRDATVRLLARRGRGLLQSGRCDALRRVVEQGHLSVAERVAVLGFVDDFLTFAVNPDPPAAARYSEEYLAGVRAWRQTLETPDLMGRLAQALSTRSLRRHSDEPAWRGELDALAGEIHEAPQDFDGVLSFVQTREHHGGAVLELARGIGRRDRMAAHLAQVFVSAATAPSPFFARGYVLGLRGFGDLHDAAVRAAIDQLEEANPGMAVDLNEMTNAAGSALVRALRLVRERRLAPEVLGQSLGFGSQPELLADALEVVLEVSADASEDAASTCLKILLAWAWAPTTILPDDARTTSAVWRALELAIDGAGAESHNWSPLLRRLSERDFERAVRLACAATVRGDFSIRDEAAREVSVYITRDPDLVLQILGPMVLESDGAIRFSIGRHGSLLSGFPRELLEQWIIEHGAAAARVVASHLPAPFIDGQGTPRLPPLTEFVLGRFGEDKGVLSSFCMGLHNSQMYCGDIASQHESEASVAERFLTHSIASVREWAGREVESSRRSAQRWREHAEEDFDE